MADITLEKNLPHNTDAERSILGSVLLENRALNQAQEILREEDFYRDGHRRIFRAMGVLRERSGVIDLVTLKNELTRSGDLESAGGTGYIASLVDGVPKSSNVEHYARIVKEKSLMRGLIEASNRIQTLCFEGELPVQDVLDEAQKQIFSLAEGHLTSGFVPIKDVAGPTLEYIDKLHGRQEMVTGLATGFERFDELTSGLQPTDLIVLAARPSMGKAQPLDARVKTRTGWKRMGDLVMGDELASLDGARSLVRGIFPQGRKETFTITFSDGRSTKATDEHLWRVHHRAWPEPRLLTTREVAERLKRKRYQHRLWIDMATGEWGQEASSLPLDPWVLGVLLGDGDLSAVRLSSADGEILDRFLERCPGFELRAAGGYDDRIVQSGGSHRPGVPGVSKNQIREALRQLGLWNLRSQEKFIPQIYLDAPRHERVLLLQGLMDTDGWVEKFGSADFCSTSERLARGVVDLARSLGAWCSLKKKSVTYTDGRGARAKGRLAWVCTLSHEDRRAFFTLHRKTSRPGATRRLRRPVFLRVEPAGREEARCISVTHPTGLYVTDDYVVTHNTALALNMAQHAATRLGSTVGVFSLEMSKEQLFLRMLCAQARVDAHHLRTGRLGKDEWARLTMAFAELTEAKIFVDDTPGVSIFEMRAKARRLKAERGLDLVIVDYLQLMRGRGRYENRTQEVSDISRSLKGLAKELRVPLIALSQLSRAPEQRGGDHKPQLSDLRECVTGDTLVQLASGERVPIRSLVGSMPDVVAIDPSGRLVRAASDRVWSVGRRAVVRVKLASGRQVQATGRHRLLSPGGWRRVDDLRPGDRVALCRVLPEPDAAQRWPEGRVALLGQLIGDGSYLLHGPMRYTTSSEENSALVAEVAVKEFGCTVKRYAGRRNWHQLLIGGNGNRWHPTGVNAWLRGLGIFGQRSYEKRVPAAAFRLQNDQIAILLRHLWATDGCIHVRNSRGASKVYYSTNSTGLAADVGAMLLRMGIVARIRRVDQGPYRPSFHVDVSGASAQQQFLERVGAFGPRVAPALELQRTLFATQPNTNVDTLPVEDFQLVKQRMSALGISQRRMAAMRGTAYGGSAHFRFAPSRSLLLEYANLLGDPELRSRATNDVFWDRVVLIEDAGEEEVFDMTVPGPASWLAADGIVSHNSGAIEQDADVVMFIYREEVYKPTEENRGMARLLIEKQRNGPTGVVDLAFIKEYTRFENLEWRSG
jgi:replicative DNA helicase